MPGLCLALPAGAGLALFLPLALAFGAKAVRVSQRIHRLDFVRLVDEGGTAHLGTEADRLQRAWVLGCIALVGLAVALLAAKLALAFAGQAELSGSIALYLGFAAVLLGGFCCSTSWRCASTASPEAPASRSPLPAFFVIVAVAAMLLSWLTALVGTLGVSAEGSSRTASRGCTTSSASSARPRTTSCGRTP